MCVCVCFTLSMKRYPMVKMELLAQWHRGHVKEYNKTKIIKEFLVVPRYKIYTGKSNPGNL